MHTLLTKGPTGFVFDIKRYSIHDGPGIRTTFFLKGCPLACWWCHNPEGISPLPAPSYHVNRCIGCGQCVQACPQRARSLGPDGVTLNSTLCVECRKCEEACPTRSIEFVGKEMSVEEIVTFAKKDLLFYDESGGGVTFSGGEPLFQADFLVACLKALRAVEISTVVDTSGFCLEADILRAAEEADLFLFDIKMIDPALHEYYTGVSNRGILSNLRRLDDKLSEQGRGRINIRIPLIPGINDSLDNLESVIEIVHSLKNVSGVNVLPYHSTGENKYKNLGLEYKMGRTLPPSDDETARVLSLFASHGIHAVKGG